jgi:hypothetical protein
MSSFFFLDNKDLIMLTTIWRAVSMTGHIAQALQLKKHITTDQLYRFNWQLSHIRNIFVSYLAYCLWLSPSLRLGFARSAIGHVGYLLVRAGPVFRLGSVYVGDRAVWQGHTDFKRLQLMVSGYFPFISIEVGSLLALCVLFLYWRLTLSLPLS